MLVIKEYLTIQGRSPFGDWYQSLDPQMRARIAVMRERMAQGNFGDHKTVGEGALETRIDLGPGYRIYYGRDGFAIVILLAGGIKRTQRRDIRKAHQCWKDYKARKPFEKSTSRKKVS
jgi:putative addiction module killer protein